ncbi:hypothetical protein OG21DRAFT_1481589 [Imleria badia]|nr:hypothetical protein OG21DRAFT_1481589 [Imleria badia]
MRFSFFAVFSGLAALAVVSAVSAENLQARAGVPSEDDSTPTKCTGIRCPCLFIPPSCIKRQIGPPPCCCEECVPIPVTSAQ